MERSVRLRLDGPQALYIGDCLKREEQAACPAAWQFSPDMLKNAVVLSEILAPPKALKRRVKR